jgi:serine/threonine protein kinase
MDLMHKAGYVHCDIKAPNIFIDADGSFRLGDYGGAVPVGDQVVQYSSGMLPDGWRGTLVEKGAHPDLDRVCLVVTMLKVLGAIKASSSSFSEQDMHRALASQGLEIRQALECLMPRTV